MKRRISIIFIIAILLSCSKESKNDLINITLHPQDQGNGVSLRWSPKGEKLMLVETDLGFEALLPLGPADLPAAKLILSKSEGESHFNLLQGDWNRNGTLDDDSILHTSPREQRGKMWSSFNGLVEIPFIDFTTQQKVVNSYPLAFWYVFDPLEEAPEQVLRFSRRGWMEGEFTIDTLKAVILLTEMKMDGIYDQNDTWALASSSDKAPLYSAGGSRSCTDHAWLAGIAYKLVSINPDGRTVTMEPFDPEMTQEEEIVVRDALAVDRHAPRSGNRVDFLHEYSAAVQKAKKESKPLLLDFETTWCGPCKQMDQWVYTADSVIAKTTNLVAVKVDGDEERDLVKEYNVSGYPTIILLAADGTEIRRAIGYQSVKQMEIFLTL